MRGNDIITSPVVTVRSETPIPEIAAMPREEFARLLNLLLEAERAGARLLAAYLDELPPGTGAWAGLDAVQRDEARNCAVLIHYLLEAGVTPSMATGDFYRKGLEMRSWRERLEFLNRGQLWVAKRIGAALLRIPPSAGKRALQAMHESHLANIALCEQLLD
jgi:nitronate monooxygenase